jgi:isochorismate hydrolase
MISWMKIFSPKLIKYPKANQDKKGIDMDNLDINIETSALLVMDCQEYIVNMLTPPEKKKVLSNMSKAIKAAGKTGIAAPNRGK